jgi:hypothetical protein
LKNSHLNAIVFFMSENIPESRRLSHRTRDIAEWIGGGLLIAAIGVGLHTHEQAEHAQEQASHAKAELVAQTKALAIQQAAAISAKLYTAEGFKQGAPIPGLLNGKITVEGNNFKPIDYNNPIILAYAHPRAKLDAKGTFLDGSWVGLPSTDENNHIVIRPIQVHLGRDTNGETETAHLANPETPVFDNALVYTTVAEGGSDELIAFDGSGEGAFPSTILTITGVK